MRIIESFPPNYVDLIKAFPDMDEHEPIFCWDDIIYNPYKRIVTIDGIAHEAVHSVQQKRQGGAQVWWNKYIEDKYFRLHEELEAYREQYKMVKKHIKDRELAAWALRSMAKAIASPLYGMDISTSEALRLIGGNGV